MKIGAAARASGPIVKAIRHYESVRLFRSVPRSGAYRDFSDRDVDTLRLAAHSRGLGSALPKRRTERAVRFAKALGYSELYFVQMALQSLVDEAGVAAKVEVNVA
jgi:hypothetical protein